MQACFAENQEKHFLLKNVLKNENDNDVHKKDNCIGYIHQVALDGCIAYRNVLQNSSTLFFFPLRFYIWIRAETVEESCVKTNERTNDQ